MEKTLVIGATGKTGKRVAERLAFLGHNVRAVSRNAVIPFDWNKQETWSSALNGMDKVYITFQPDLAVPGSVQIIKAFTAEAKKSDIKKIVLLSGRGEKEAQECEKIVMQSGIDWTIIRASWFMQNYSEGFFLDSILSGHFIAPIVTAKAPLVDADDIAAVVVQALINESHSKKIYDLTGPEQLSLEEAVVKISAVLKKDIVFQEVSMDEYVAMLREYQTPEDYIWLVKYLFTEVLIENNAAITNDVELVLKRKPTSFNDYATITALTGVWAQQINHV